MNRRYALVALVLGLAACTPATPPANLPNPASTFCTQQGHRLEIRTAADGSQSGVCVFAAGGECDEWAYFRGECGPAAAALPTALPIDPAGYEGWWTYTEPGLGFTLRLPGDWVVEAVTTGDAVMNGHTLTLRPEHTADPRQIRLAFRRAGDDAVRLWPTGVGQGEFIQQDTLTIAGAPAERWRLVCPDGKVTALWYHDGEGQPNLRRGALEFGVIYSLGAHCQAEQSLSGKVQWVGEMIIASLRAP